MKKIIFVFLINFVFLIILGFVSINKINTLSELNKKLYEHPYAVSNATKVIQLNIISMHRYMKDIASAKNMDDINKAKQQVEANQKIVLEQFDIIFKKYLGNKKDIQKSYDTFIHWEEIRNEVIALIINTKYREAYAITKDKGAKYIANLDLEINKLVIFANNKANSFHQATLEANTQAQQVIIILMIIISLISFSIFGILLRSILIKDKKIKEYFDLIDENIMNIILDSNCKIIKASSALSKYMKMSKEELVKKEYNFLLSDCTSQERSDIANIMQNGSTWKGEIKKTVDGQIKWLDSSLHPDTSNKETYTNILHDITDKKKFEKLSKIDALTNLHNRGYFNSIFPSMIKISQRNKTILCFAMIDIDFFKQYNDIYGHQRGDDALKQVADTLNFHLNRPDDFAFRLGGEEFGVLLTVKEEKKALPFMQKLLREIESLQIEHSGNQVSKFLTISMGITIIKHDDNFNIDELYKKTDDLLYKAKQNGRNSIQM